MIPEFEKFKRFKAKNLPKEELLAPGHRACQGCGEVLALRMAMKALGPNVIVCMATGCMEIITTPYPQTAWKVPWIHIAFENPASVASGIESALKVLRRKGKVPKRHIDIVAIGGDGATSDIGLGWISGAFERGHDFTYICLDNEAYMNTGVQRSSCTPYGAMTTTSPPGEKSFGQVTWKKNVPGIAVAHNIPYVATASPAYFLDLMNKVKKAALVKGPAYVHIYSPCPTGWGSAPERSIEFARLAVETRVFPLYEVIEGRYIMSRKITKPKPVQEYLKGQRRFRHLDEEHIAHIQQRVNADYEKLVRLSEMT
ncbi:MAG: pyruvate synthase subunit beta [Deltaproteobacteria bacterium]|nr:pyruvate synthase subunit beta [Deltaproteobacteria bacterium]MBW1966993.1 pyruvate synthase subunit beta [Deltaproteobacteria bacterium]MBW2097552.1 pyruvate synthase subunit beta [Deltaproteobacteria bacterium]PXF55530.1 MAG: pyruvate synthase subunit beta [Deltaproteobacteria bacterium]RKX60180.1 MAG: pyruvate synthase subunit beta [Thermodesulfobacteriota bacterium]